MDVKQAVKKRYGKIARGRGACCGGKARQEEGDPRTIAAAIGYDETELRAVPEGANLGLGCGNPLAMAEVGEGDTVLDLGSGAGFDCLLAAARVGPTGRVIGVDMTEDMIARARDNASKAGCSNVEFRLGEIECLPVEDASVDLVISNCVLNLVPDKAAAFREIARVLKRGGRVMVSDIVRRGELPAELLPDVDSYVACIGGAIEADEYLGLMQAAGLAQPEILSESDAADLLGAAPDCACCDAEGQTLPDRLRGRVFSVTVRARRA